MLNYADMHAGDAVDLVIGRIGLGLGLALQVYKYNN